MCSVKAAPKKVSLFVSRLQSGTKSEDLVTALRETFPEAVCEEVTPKHPESYASFKVFCEKLEQIFEENFDSSTNFILCGDFNVDPIRDEINCKALTSILERIESTKRLYYANKINNSKNVTKGAWNVVQMLRNKIHSRIKDNNAVIINTDQLADKFNPHFVDTPKNIVRKIPFVKYYDGIERNTNTMFLFPFDEKEFLSLMAKKLKPKYSCGFDGIPSFLIKKCINELTAPLVHLINLSFCEGTFPEQLKLNKIIPVFKKGDKDIMSNYRPIALSPVLSKIFEYCFVERLMHFFDIHNLLSKNQFGFRPNHRTSDAIYAFIENVVNHMESGEYTAGLFCDLSSAFDCVVHDILKVKAEKYGIRGKVLDWLDSYLSNRKQYVSLKSTSKNGCNSNINSHLLANDIGVPQGSILGPVLFLIYINDLSEELDFDIWLYADDTTATTSGKDKEVVQTRLHENFNKLHKWFSRNTLYMNTVKTNYIVFRNYNTSNFDINLSVDGEQLERPTHVNFLGVCIDEHLNWKAHCEVLNAKLNSVCYLIRSLKRVVASEQLLSVYHAQVSSRLRYGVCFWGTSPSALKIFKTQKRIIRILSNITQRSSCKNSFKKFNVLTLPSIVIMELALLIYNNQNDFNRNKDFHEYSTRGREMYTIPLTKYRIGRHSPAFLGVKIFNKLGNDIKNIKNQITFKNKLKTFLLERCYYTIDEFLLE
nr:unnamed protein product [Callosobruchus chinensis]